MRSGPWGRGPPHSSSPSAHLAPHSSLGDTRMNTIDRHRLAPRLGLAALVCGGAFALGPAPLAQADPGNGQGQAPGQAQAPGQSQAPAPASNHPQAPVPSNNPASNPGNGGDPGHGGGQSPSSDPAGNNGTVKIAPLGDFDGIPNNTPHVGCTFLVEWYGFDQGADIISTVSFAEQAPTTGVGMTVSGPSQVFVGGDPASGAGTATGLDGRQQYTLSF